jgi:phosphoribosylglycinamide formyltransferase 2
MVTLGNTQNLSEFELHARAVLGLPIPNITLEKAGASAVILADKASEVAPCYEGVEDAIALPNTDIRIFGKIANREHRRMGVVLTYGPIGTSLEDLRTKCKAQAAKVKIIN